MVPRLVRDRFCDDSFRVLLLLLRLLLLFLSRICPTTVSSLVVVVKSAITHEGREHASILAHDPLLVVFFAPSYMTPRDLKTTMSLSNAFVLLSHFFQFTSGKIRIDANAADTFERFFPLLQSSDGRIVVVTHY
jgi:hypothetical protein